MSLRKVLVIEDNPDNLRLITYALKRAGYEVISTGSGEEGIEVALRERPFFIVMDVNLPGIDGLEATKRIRKSEIGGNIPIIAVTSYALLGDRESAINAGCNGYIEKPIDPLVVVKKIEEIIGQVASSKGLEWKKEDSEA